MGRQTACVRFLERTGQNTNRSVRGCKCRSPRTCVAARPVRIRGYGWGLTVCPGRGRGPEKSRRRACRSSNAPYYTGISLFSSLLRLSCRARVARAERAVHYGELRTGPPLLTFSPVSLRGRASPQPRPLFPSLSPPSPLPPSGRRESSPEGIRREGRGLSSLSKGGPPAEGETRPKGQAPAARTSWCLGA